MSGLVFVGKILSLDKIENADFIVSATVVCGAGGKWQGIVRAADFTVANLCTVFLPDSLIPPRDDMLFMKDSGWRVKMRRFRGAPSEVVITRAESWYCVQDLGRDVTDTFGVTKYNKPVPACLNGDALGHFPNFIPKTDEPNYQRERDLVDRLVGKPYYVSEKCDGSSTTAYRWNGIFGLCSRNLELKRNEDNGYWKVAIKYNLEETLPEGIALQWETCGPGIQSNPQGLKELDGFAFSAYNIAECRYLDYAEFNDLTISIGFPTCRTLKQGLLFSKEYIETLGEGCYSNEKTREGVVVRSQENVLHNKPISFKVINLDYER